MMSFIVDYVNGGELFTHLVQRVRFKEQEVALYSGEIVLALEHLHKVSLIQHNQGFFSFLMASCVCYLLFYNYNDPLFFCFSSGLSTGT